MAKWISLIVSCVIGAVLAIFATWGIVSSSTAAPDHNPAGTQVVDYGHR